MIARRGLGLAATCWLLLACLCCNAAGQSFSVLTQNLGDTARKRMPPAELVITPLEADADILLLQEVPQDNPRKPAFFKLLGYPDIQCGGNKDRGTRALCIASRFPMSNLRSLVFQGREHLACAVCVTALVHGQPIQVCNVHLDPTYKGRDASGTAVYSTLDLLNQLYTEVFKETPRSRSIEELIPWLERAGLPTIIGGDFNTIFLSKAIRKLKDTGYQDTLSGRADYFTGTYRRINLPIKPRVDFIFSSPGLDAVESNVRENPRGDHNGVEAAFTLTTKSQ